MAMVMGFSLKLVVSVIIRNLWSGFGTLSLDLVGKVSSDGFSFCATLFLSGENGIDILLESPGDNLKISFCFWTCITERCDLWFKLGNQSWLEISQKLPKNKLSGWLNMCAAINPGKRQLSASIDNTIVVEAEYEPRSFRSLKIKPNSYHGFYLPEKVTMFNIHRLTQNWHLKECGEEGDLYAWNARDWRDRDLDQVPITQSVKNIVCKNLPIRILPSLVFDDAVDICDKLNHGQLYFGDIEEFKQIIIHNNHKVDGRYLEFWIPYRAFGADDGNYYNIYNRSLKHDPSLFYENGENPGRDCCTILILSFLNILQVTDRCQF